MTKIKGWDKLINELNAVAKDPVIENWDIIQMKDNDLIMYALGTLLEQTRAQRESRK